MRQQIYNALFKESKEVELSKVELGAIQDMESLSKEALIISNDKTIISKADRLEATFEKAFKELDSLKNDYTNQRKASDDVLKKLNSSFTKVDKQAKELGLKITDLPVYKDYIKARESISEYRDDAQKAWDKVGKFTP